MPELLIREFQPGDEAHFRRLNEEWIVRYFRLEAKDVQSLSDPHGTILDRSGRIFFAEQGGETIGCCALVVLGPGEFEIAKMAVTASAQGQGIGKRLLTHVIDEARSAGARRLWLETNHAMIPAVRLYESLGFRHLPPERVTPSAYARSDVSMELLLTAS